MTDNDIIKALECCTQPTSNCDKCPLYKVSDECFDIAKNGAVDIINRQQAEIDDLFYKLTGVMHSVDKWLDDDELKQDEVSRALKMREKTLQIIEKQKAEKENLIRTYAECQAEAVKDFAEKVKNELSFGRYITSKQIDNLVKEKVGEQG